jgi:hypothetical protein
MAEKEKKRLEEKGISVPKNWASNQAIMFGAFRDSTVPALLMQEERAKKDDSKERFSAIKEKLTSIKTRLSAQKELPGVKVKSVLGKDSSGSDVLLNVTALKIAPILDTSALGRIFKWNIPEGAPGATGSIDLSKAITIEQDFTEIVNLLGEAIEQIEAAIKNAEGANTSS